MCQRWEIIPKMSDFFVKSALYVLKYISRLTNALHKPMPNLESRKIALSNGILRFFKQTSSSASKIHLKSGNLPKIKVKGRRPETRIRLKTIITVRPNISYTNWRVEGRQPFSNLRRRLLRAPARSDGSKAEGLRSDTTYNDTTGRWPKAWESGVSPDPSSQ